MSTNQTKGRIAQYLRVNRQVWQTHHQPPQVVALNQLTKLLNLHHLTNDDIHGANFRNVGPLSKEDRVVVRPEIVSKLRVRSRDTDHFDSKEINDIECKALAMLRDHTLLNPTRNNRRSNMSKPCRREQHDTRTEMTPGRSFNSTEDRDSFEDEPDGLGLNPKVTEMEVERTSLPGYLRRPNSRTTKLRSMQRREGGKQKKMKGRRSMTIDTEYKTWKKVVQMEPGLTMSEGQGPWL